jgi:hypothetical protein
MTRERAFWESVATVCIPSVLVWGLVAYLFRANARGDEWPIYLFLFALPLPLIFPIFSRYRRGAQLAAKVKSRRYHTVLAVLYVAIAAIYVAEGSIHHGQRMDLWSQLIGAAFWLFFGIQHAYRAAKTPATPPISGQGAITNNS